MEIMLALLCGVLVAAGAYLMMSGRTLPYIFGLTMISNAANLLIFAAGRLTFGKPPLVPADAKTVAGAANALPQALILTAIVIGFGLLVFALTLAYRSYYVLGTTEMDAMRVAEPPAVLPRRRAEVLLFWPLVIPFFTAVLCILAWRSLPASARHLPRRRAGPPRRRPPHPRRRPRATAPSPSRPAAGRRPSASPWSPTGSPR